MAATAGTIVVNVQADTSQARREIKRLRRQLNRPTWLRAYAAATTATTAALSIYLAVR